MIDKRVKTDFSLTEKDDRLNQLSDSEIILEFSKILTSIYPHLVKIYANCYDPFDDIAEGLYNNFVYQTFAAKYAKLIDYSETHRYGLNLHCYHKINHIELKPKEFPISLICNSESVALTIDQFQDIELIFIQFGDTVNNLTGGEDYVNVETVNFNYSEIAIVDKETGLRFRNTNNFWVDNALVEFELVLEDYDNAEHQFYKNDLFTDKNLRLTNAIANAGFACSLK
jgi:hypothetical protein